MFNYLKLEYQKFGKNAVVTMLSMMFLVFLPTLIFVGRLVQPIPPIFLSNDVFFEFPTVWNWMGYAGNWLVYFFLGFIAVHIITNEVSDKTMRQAVINGQTRTQFFLSKLTLITTIAILATLYYAICTLVIGWFNTKEPNMTMAFENEYAIPRFFLMSMGYLTFGMMMGIVIRRSGIAVLLYWTYVLFLEPIIRWAGHKRVFDNETMNYYPMNALEDLHPNPFFNFARFIPQEVDFPFLLSYKTASILTIIYIVIFVFLAYRHLLTRDM